MTAFDFNPEFDNSVYEYLGAMQHIVAINPRYCLTAPSAKLLSTLFTPAPAIFLGAPITQSPLSPFRFNHFVPWFRFSDGTERNAAVLAQYFDMPGVPRARVLEFINLDITTPVEG